MSKLPYVLSEKGSTLKGKNLLPLGVDLDPLKTFYAKRKSAIADRYRENFHYENMPIQIY